MLWYYSTLILIDEAATQVYTIVASGAGCADYSTSMCRETLLEVWGDEEGQYGLL